MNPSNANTHPSHRVARQGAATLILATSILLIAGSWAAPATSAQPAHVKGAAVATNAAVINHTHARKHTHTQYYP